MRLFLVLALTSVAQAVGCHRGHFPGQLNSGSGSETPFIHILNCQPSEIMEPGAGVEAVRRIDPRGFEPELGQNHKIGNIS
jgi:hypothetical protein